MTRAILLVALVAVCACQSPEERVAEHRARAEAYVREGKGTEALLELRSALKADATDPETCRRIARLYEALGDRQQAYFFYLEASRLDPKNYGTKLEVARLLLGDDVDEAARLTEEVLEAEADNPSAWLRLAEVRLVQADADAALAAALTATELAPDSPNAVHQVGRVHLARYRRARLLSAERDAGYESLLEQALASFDRAAELYAQSRGGAENQLERARVLGLLGRESEAEEAFKTALELALNPQQQGKVLEGALDYGRRNSAAIRNWALAQQIRIQPRAVSAWVEYAEQARRDDPAKGLEVLDRMVEANPDIAAARLAYARYLARHDREDDAIAYLAEAEATEDVEPKPPIALDRAILLLQRRDYAGARAIADRLARDHPDAAETALLGAQLALIDGRVDEAINVLTASLESSGERVSTRRMLAQSYYAAGDRNRAVVEVNEVLAVAPRDHDMLSLRAQIQLEQGLVTDAIRSFRQLDRVRPLTDTERVLYARAYYRAGRPARGRAILMQQLTRRSSPPAVIAFAEGELKREPEKARELLESVQGKTGPRLKHKILELLVALDLQEQKYQAALDRVHTVFTAGKATPATLLLRAKVLLAMGQLQLAERDLLSLIGRGASDPEAVNMLVQLYSVQGRSHEAIASFEEASQAGVLPPETLVVLARLYWAEGDLDRALELLDEAVEARADLAHAKNDLAYLLAERGENLERALELAQQARAALPGDPNTADTLGWVYLRRGLAEPAIEQFREALGTSGPDTATAIFHHHLGLALRDAGRLEDARASFEAALASDPEFAKKDEAAAALESIRASG